MKASRFKDEICFAFRSGYCAAKGYKSVERGSYIYHDAMPSLYPTEEEQKINHEATKLAAIRAAILCNTDPEI